MYRYVFLYVVVVFNVKVLSSQVNSFYEKGSCQNPYEITDAVNSIDLSGIDKDRIWFTFTAPENNFYLNCFDNNSEQYNYMIFKYDSSDFCSKINRKLLISERNKVCSNTIEIDASMMLSRENIERGVCNCASCCFSQTLFKGKKNQRYFVVVYNPKENIHAMISTTDSIFIKDVEEEDVFNINKIEVGQAISMENIYFFPGRADILRESYPALNKLSEFLISYPQIHIQIQGHVNAPNSKPDKHHSDNLAEKRAKAVNDYLINKGVSRERLSYEGFGNTQMVFPNAVTEVQMVKNRRVEVIILSK